jgi:hypothetical protein
MQSDCWWRVHNWVLHPTCRLLDWWHQGGIIVILTSATLLFWQYIHLAPRFQFCVFLIVVSFAARDVMVVLSLTALAIASPKDVKGQAHLHFLVVLWYWVHAEVVGMLIATTWVRLPRLG